MSAIVQAAEIKNVLLTLESTTKRNEKIAILEKERNNNNLYNFVKFVFNPYKITGISSKKLQKGIPTKSSIFIKDMDELYDYFTFNYTGKDIDIANINRFIESLPEDLQEIPKMAVLKQCKVGIDAKTINKVWKKAIPEFNVMLANKFQDKAEKVLKQELIIDSKIDGGRCFIVKNGDAVLAYNRSGIALEGIDDITDEIKEYKDFNGIIDGELYAIGKFGSSKEAYKETMKRSRIKGKKTGLELRAFDLLTLDEFENQKGTIPYKTRRETLTKLLKDNNAKFVKVLPVIMQGILTKETIDACCKEETEKGNEGIMIKVANAVYEFKRSDNLLKYKLFNDIDLTCIDMVEGTGKYVGKLGALVVSYKGNTVEVGTGLSDEDREELWNNKKDYIGKVVTVKYFEETTNDHGGHSLRFPCYRGFNMEDKEADA
jgi:DNA ligase-1